MDTDPTQTPASTPVDTLAYIRDLVSRGVAGSKTQRILLDVPENLANRLTSQADDLGVTPTEFLKLFLDQALPR